jgi:hypothetical protein
MRLTAKVLLAVLGTIALPSFVEAGPIALRSTLDAMLGGGAVNEDFEAYPVGSSYAVLGPSFDSTSTPNGQGPGLIVPGVVLSTNVGNVIWQAAGFFGLPTKTIGSDVSQNVRTDFTGNVNAFGVDLLNYEGFGAVYNVTIFGVDDSTVIGTIPGIVFPSAVTSNFVGFYDAGGIGSFRVDVPTGFGPVIDNLEFGVAAPEPGSLLLLGTGVLAVARRVRRRETV